MNDSVIEDILVESRICLRNSKQGCKWPRLLQDGTLLFSSSTSVKAISQYALEQTEKGSKEGNGLFNDALNTFYLRLYSDSERGNPLPPPTFKEEGNVEQ